MYENTKLQNANQSRPIEPHIRLDRDWVFNARAEFAKELAHAAMNAGTFGKCRQEYQEMHLMTPLETVKRACDIADALYSEIEARGWLMKVPLYDEMLKQLRDDAPGPAGFMRKVEAER